LVRTIVETDLARRKVPALTPQAVDLRSPGQP